MTPFRTLSGPRDSLIRCPNYLKSLAMDQSRIHTRLDSFLWIAYLRERATLTARSTTTIRYQVVTKDLEFGGLTYVTETNRTMENARPRIAMAVLHITTPRYNFLRVSHLGMSPITQEISAVINICMTLKPFVRTPDCKHVTSCLPKT